MKIFDKIINYFVSLIKVIIPKSEIEKILDEINKLKSTSENYGKVAMMYYKLHNIYGVLLGKNHEDDILNFHLCNFYETQYKIYREMYIENNGIKIKGMQHFNKDGMCRGGFIELLNSK